MLGIDRFEWLVIAMVVAAIGIIAYSLLVGLL